eukprot:PhF_6_TR41935/c0_g1_i1/m.63468/K09022/ridA, tdcF, RIDA; 2-iminobutanoate/2-iminopropanoate deaminase
MIRHVVVPNLAILPDAFSHATVADSTIYLSGTLGTVQDTSDPRGFRLISSSIADQTTQTLRNMETILISCGSSFNDVVKLNVFLKDNNPDRFNQMNKAYTAFFVERKVPVCARITVGCGNLALGADVEIDGFALKR